MARRTAFLALVLLALSAGCSSTGAHRATTPTVPASSTSLPLTTESASTSTTAAKTATTTSGTTSTVPPSNGCTNLQASPQVDAALAQANSSPGSEAIPPSVYYGLCGKTAYAVARFEPSSPDYAGNFQDEGAAPHYFIEMPGQAWKLVADGPNFPQHMRDCSTFTQLPEALRTLWQDCPNG